MKTFIVNPNVTGAIDPNITNQVLRYFPNVATQHHADVVIVPVVYQPNFTFSQELESLKKPIVLLDYTEYGWDWSGTENVLGRGNTTSYGHLNQKGYQELDEWASRTKFLVHFKRELLRKDVTENLIPCDFTCYLPKEPVQTKEEFNARPIEVMHQWGYSHDLRRKLHGEIFAKAQEFGYNVIDHPEDKIEGRTWATFHTPYYRRWPQSQVQDWCRKSKITVSLPGAGVKCFRSAEAPNASVMALPNDDLAWSYEWTHGLNCIRLLGWDRAWNMFYYQDTPALYEIYVNSQETIDLYRSENYVNNYLIQNIKDRL